MNKEYDEFKSKRTLLDLITKRTKNGLTVSVVLDLYLGETLEDFYFNCVVSKKFWIEGKDQIDYDYLSRIAITGADMCIHEINEMFSRHPKFSNLWFNSYRPDDEFPSKIKQAIIQLYDLN